MWNHVGSIRGCAWSKSICLFTLMMHRAEAEQNMSDDSNPYHSPAGEAAAPLSGDADSASLSRTILITGFITIAGLAALNLHRTLTFTPSDRVMPHEVLQNFMMLWGVFAFVYLLTAMTFCFQRSWTNALIAVFALCSCLAGFTVNAWFWVQCIASI